MKVGDRRWQRKKWKGDFTEYFILFFILIFNFVNIVHIQKLKLNLKYERTTC